MLEGTVAYLPPERFEGKVGRKGDIFSLGIIFVELGLLFFGQKGLKEEFTSGFYTDMLQQLAKFLKDRFPLVGNSIMDDWNKHFQELITTMLDVAPGKRPIASAVWENLKEMIESLGAEPHCETVSPVGSIPYEHDEDTEFQLRENMAKLM